MFVLGEREDNESTQGKKSPSRVENQVEHVNIQDPNETWATFNLVGDECHYTNVEFLNWQETNSFSHLTFLENVEKNNQPVFTEVFRVLIGWHGLKVIQYRSQSRLLSRLVRMSDCLTPAMYIPWNTCGTNAHQFVSYEKQNDFKLALNLEVSGLTRVHAQMTTKHLVKTYVWYGISDWDTSE